MIMIGIFVSFTSWHR